MQAHYKKWVVLTHFGYLSFIPFSMSLNNFYSPMTFTNDLENQIKFLICLESKAGSGTSLCLMMQTIKWKVMSPNWVKTTFAYLQCANRGYIP